MSLAIHEGNFQPKIATEKGKEKPIFSNKYSVSNLNWLCPEKIVDQGVTDFIDIRRRRSFS